MRLSAPGKMRRENFAHIAECKETWRDPETAFVIACLALISGSANVRLRARVQRRRGGEAVLARVRACCLGPGWAPCGRANHLCLFVARRRCQLAWLTKRPATCGDTFYREEPIGKVSTKQSRHAAEGIAARALGRRGPASVLIATSRWCRHAVGVSAVKSTGCRGSALLTAGLQLAGRYVLDTVVAFFRAVTP